MDKELSPQNQARHQAVPVQDALKLVIRRAKEGIDALEEAIKEVSKEKDMISPTGKSVRGADKFGLGKYGASRGGQKHKGTDYICESDQSVYAPISGVVEREARPYPSGEYSGLVIRNNILTIKMFYLEPYYSLIGKKVEMGQVIGTAQAISGRHSGITEHIHLEVESIDPEFLRELFQIINKVKGN